MVTDHWFAARRTLYELLHGPPTGRIASLPPRSTPPPIG